MDGVDRTVLVVTIMISLLTAAVVRRFAGASSFPPRLAPVVCPEG